MVSERDVAGVGMLQSCKTMDMCPGVDQRSVRGAASAVTVEANLGVAVPEASEGALCSSQLSTSVAECSFNFRCWVPSSLAGTRH